MTTRGPAAALAAMLAVAVLLPGAPARAQRALTPPTRFGVIAAGRENVGTFRDQYDWGALGGFVAGYMPSWIPVGVMWSVLFGYFHAANSTVVDQGLSTVETNFGLHARLEISEVSLRYLFATGGVTLLRSEDALAPDDSRIFVGPYFGVGWEEYFLGRFLVGAELRYGLVGGGPSGVSLNLSLSFGTH